MEEQATKKRPVFLTVLCILSFIGAGWSIIANVIAFFAYKAANALTTGLSESLSEGMEGLENMEGLEGMEGLENVEGMEDFGNAMNDAFAGMGEYATKVAENGATVSIINAILAIVALFGVIMMWKLKKSGFWTYTAAQILMLIIPLVFYGFSTMAILGLGVGAVFTILFIILFGVNLKHMS